MKRIKIFVSALMIASTVMAADVQTNGNNVTIRPDGGQAKVIKLEVMNDNIIRVRATSKDVLPVKPASLMIVPQVAPAKGYTISDEGDKVVVKAKNVKAVVSKATGQITFFDAKGNQLLKEAQQGKKFWDFTVPERELGMKTGYTVPEEQKHGLSWQMKFDSPDDEAFYGLGQHQSEEFNMKGKNEDLFQYNTKVSIPFVLSNKNYGLLWDSYSYCRFGNPDVMSMPVVRSWYAMRIPSIMNMVPPRNQLSPSKPTMAVSRTSPRRSTSLVPTSPTRALSSPKLFTLHYSLFTINLSCITLAMSRYISTVRR